MKRIKIALLAAATLVAMPTVAAAQDRPDRPDNNERPAPPQRPHGEYRGNGHYGGPPSGQPPRADMTRPGGPGGPPPGTPQQPPGGDGRGRFGGPQGQPGRDWQRRPNGAMLDNWEGQRRNFDNAGNDGNRWNRGPGRPDDGRGPPPGPNGGVRYDDHRPDGHGGDNHWGTGDYRRGPDGWRGDGDHRWGETGDHRWGGDPRGGYGRPGPGYGRPGPGAGRPGGDWNRHYDGGWRNDRRYDWRGWRDTHRNLYRFDYRPPSRWSYGYRSVYRGFTLEPFFYASSYWLADPYEYRLPQVEWPLRWIHYYDDAILVDVTTGEVVDVIQGFFY